MSLIWHFSNSKTQAKNSKWCCKHFCYHIFISYNLCRKKKCFTKCI